MGKVIEIAVKPNCNFGTINSFASDLARMTRVEIWPEERKDSEGRIEGRSVFVNTNKIDKKTLDFIMGKRFVHGIIKGE